MSRINSLRIINLNYNNSTMKIDDETFDLGGESTLMSLRNGGGKSVMVQMMIAPFVTKRYRNMKDREFNSYFTSISPTYILTEWLLDDEKTNVLIGMMVKRKTTSLDEEDEDEIDIINFIHEYEVESKYSLSNIPIVEKTEKGKTIKNFSNSKNLFEKLKKDTDINFNYYQMNVSNQSRNYFETLKQYKINHKEWESIIKEINKKESGLSELFSNSKTIAGLVEKWFIKVVGDKLNQNKDKIKSFEDIIKKYIYQYKENEHKLKKKEAIEKFEILTKEILNKAYEFKNTKDNTIDIENKLANLIKYLEELQYSENNQIESLDNVLECIKECINDLEYEKLSLNIYKREDEYSKILETESKIVSDMKNLDNKISETIHKRNIMDCALKHENYQKSSKDVLETENKIYNLKTEEKELQPERENYGFTLKKYYINRESKLNEDLSLNLNLEVESNKKLNEFKNILDEVNIILNNKNANKGLIQGSVNNFYEEEKLFNKRYNKDFSRSIVGFYEENFIESTKIKYTENIQASLKNIENYKLERLKIEENIRINQRTEKEISSNLTILNIEKENLIKNLNIINKNIEKRKEVLKYIDSDDSHLFDDVHIGYNLDKKLSILNDENNNLILKNKKIENEIQKLISGKTIDLSREIQEILNKKDIHIAYGMQWLKENNYSEEDNLKLVKINPLIPYSIILNKNDIEKLKSETLNIFTSYPIPIIERESLDQEIGKCKNEIFILNKSMFLLAFNEKLLNEKELKNIIDKLENDKVKLKNRIKHKKLEIEKYTDLIYYIKDNSLSKSIYDKLNQSIKNNENSIKKSEESFNNLIEELKTLLQNQKNINDKINNASIKHKEYLTEEADFNDFSLKYQRYINSKEKLIEVEDEIEKTKDYLKKQNNQIEILIEKINILKDEKRNIEDKLNKTKENIIKYKSYNKGELINKDIEDLEARYESLTNKISLGLKELEEILEKYNERQNSDEQELIVAQNNYNLIDSDYKDVIYNINTKTILENEIKQLELLKNKKNEEEKHIYHTKGSMEKEISILYEKINKEFDKEHPKCKELVTDKDFEKLIFIEKNKEKNLNKEKNTLKYNISVIENNLNSLSEFSYLEILSEIKLEVKIKDLKNYIASTKRDYNISKDEEQKNYVRLTKEIDSISREDEFINDDFFKRSLDVINVVSENPSEVISNLDQILAAHKFTLEKLSADIEIINKEKEKVVEILYDYINEVHTDIGKIDKNSSIKINEKDVKMLNIKTSDWEGNKDLYKLKTKNLLESLTIACLSKLKNNENIEESISKSINTKNLYNEVVSIGSIDVKLYKIEENKHRMISWEQVCQNSGGEGFLSAFIVLNSLLSYMRKSDSDIFKNNGDSKVIIMDNPFAQTNAEHLLKPLMDIAKKSNTQLICFSGLKGDSIYNRFENIYVLDLVNSKMKNNLSFLRGNHYKGEDLVQEVISSRFEIKEEEVDQMSLF